MDTEMQDVPPPPAGHPSERAARYTHRMQHRRKDRKAEEALKEQQASAPATMPSKKKIPGKVRENKGDGNAGSGVATKRQIRRRNRKSRRKRLNREAAKHAAIVIKCLEEIKRQPGFQPTVQVGIPVEPGNEANFLAGTRITVDLPAQQAGLSSEPLYEPTSKPHGAETPGAVPTNKHTRFPDDPVSDASEVPEGPEPGYGILVRNVPVKVSLEDVQRAFSEFGPVVELEVNEIHWSTATEEAVIQYIDYASVVGAVHNMNGVASGNQTLSVLPLGKSDLST